MKFLKSIGDILNNYQDEKEVYSTDQAYRNKRKQKGYFTRDGGDSFSFIHLIKAWEEIVGKMLANNSIPLKINRQTLYIMTKHQIFAQELSFLDQSILEKIHDKFPELTNKIQKIKYINNEFTLQDFNHPTNQTVDLPIKKPKLHPYSPEYKKKMHEAQHLFADIQDEDVKTSLIKYYLNS